MHCKDILHLSADFTSSVCASALVCAALVFGLLDLGPARGDDTPFAQPVNKLPLGLPARSAMDDDPARIAYGAFLFQSKELSLDRSLACASCHVPALGFSGASPIAIGVRVTVGRRHAPALFNLYLSRQFMLDGRAASLVDQIHLPIESITEMSADWQVLLSRLAGAPETRAVLSATTDRSLNEALVVKSLAAYLETLVSGGSPFDRFYYGGEQQAISQQAKDGLTLFVRKGRCSGCHLITGYSAPLTDGSFHSVGVGFEGGSYRDLGRFAVTRLEIDRGAFKTPSLRNVAQRRYFMHDGSMTSLLEVIEYYNKGGHSGAPNQDGRVRPLFLNDAEMEALVAFLKTLSAPIQSYSSP
jgi:cytochrome c peroxidase